MDARGRRGDPVEDEPQLADEDEGDSSPSDEEDEPRRAGAVPAPNERLERIALFDFLRLVAGGPGHERIHAATNSELLAHLRGSGTLSSDSVYRAMLACPRDLFVPRRYLAEALMDVPVRVEEHGFNISAPHMHATSLEALELKPGQRVLDVGCGCGIVAAYAAYLVGRSGEVVGVDIRQEAVDMSQASTLRLREHNAEFAELATPQLSFQRHNVFIPSRRHIGRYDAVHVGGAVPPERVGALLQLLGPEGGAVVVPINSDLRLFTKQPDGAVRSKTISQVRFSELEVPRDAEVVLAMERERAQEARCRNIKVPTSSYTADMAHIAPALRTGNGAAATTHGSAAAASSAAAAATTSASAGRSGSEKAGGWVAAVAAEEPAGAEEEGDERPGAACGDGGGDDEEPASAGGLKRAKTHEGQDAGSAGCGADPAYLDAPGLPLGPPDCTLAGDGWRLPAHRAVLQARCDLLRAHIGSGMRDSDSTSYGVPDAVSSREAMEGFLHYVYQDTLPQAPLDTSLLPQVLHAGIYYGCPRLVALCEAQLADELIAARSDGEAAAAASAMESVSPLLQLADESGLERLKELALQFIVERYPCVAATETYRSLPRHLVDCVTAAAVERHDRLVEQLQALVLQAQGKPAD